MSDVASENEAATRIFNTITKSKDISYTLRRTQRLPTLTINNLSGNRKAGEVHKFSVQVNAPGTYAGYVPQLDVFYDSTNAVTERGLEQNGAFYVRMDESKTSPEKTGDETWVFHFVFDTRNNPMLTQFDKNMQPVVNATQLLVRLSFQARTPFGTSSDKKMLNFAIDLNNNAQASTGDQL